MSRGFAALQCRMTVHLVHVARAAVYPPLIHSPVCITDSKRNTDGNHCFKEASYKLCIRIYLFSLLFRTDQIYLVKIVYFYLK